MKTTFIKIKKKIKTSYFAQNADILITLIREKQVLRIIERNLIRDSTRS